ncbi:DDE domain-containing protein [Streptomyces sp. 1331.2]|nr:DDE domain-containing protein [Streptomyces sp. 1331.2]
MARDDHQGRRAAGLAVAEPPDRIRVPHRPSPPRTLARCRGRSHCRYLWPRPRPRRPGTPTLVLGLIDAPPRPSPAWCATPCTSPTASCSTPTPCASSSTSIFIRIDGEQKYLWRAVDADGNVLDILVQNRRDKAAARRFFRRLLRETGFVPRVVVTDKLRSYGAADREVMPSVEHRSHKGLNNWTENSHQPTRQRERAMKRFRSVGGAQRFLTAFSGISPHFRPGRHNRTAPDHHHALTPRQTPAPPTT